jgi:hypothetical protein
MILLWSRECRILFSEITAQQARDDFSFRFFFGFDEIPILSWGAVNFEALFVTFLSKLTTCSDDIVIPSIPKKDTLFSCCRIAADTCFDVCLAVRADIPTRESVRA